MGLYSLTNKTRDRISKAQERPHLTLQRELEIALTVQVNKARLAKKEGNVKMKAHAERMVSDIQDQLMILFILDEGLIDLLFKGCFEVQS